MKKSKAENKTKLKKTKHTKNHKKNPNKQTYR